MKAARVFNHFNEIVRELAGNRESFPTLLAFEVAMVGVERSGTPVTQITFEASIRPEKTDLLQGTETPVNC